MPPERRLLARKIEVCHTAMHLADLWWRSTGDRAADVYERQGDFHADRPRRGARFKLAGTRAGTQAPTMFSHVLEGQTRSIMLAVGSTVTGRVVKDGQPLSGVKMLLIQVDHLSETWLGRRLRSRTIKAHSRFTTSRRHSV